MEIRDRPLLAQSCRSYANSIACYAQQSIIFAVMTPVPMKTRNKSTKLLRVAAAERKLLELAVEPDHARRIAVEIAPLCSGCADMRSRSLNDRLWRAR
jgi:hypothetical protein